MYHWLQHDQKNIHTILKKSTATASEYFDQQQTLPPTKPTINKQVQGLQKDGIGAEKTLQYFQEHVAPHMGNPAGPRYFGFVTGGSTPASVAGDWLVSAYDNNLSHYSGGVGGFIEKQTIHFLKNLFGLDADYSGQFVTGATMSNFVGLATARQWIGEQHGVDISEKGLQAAKPIAIISGTPHSSTIKSMAMLGLGRESLQKVDTLPNREAIDIAKLEKLLKQQEGPTIVVANAGTVNTVDFDDLHAIGQLKKDYNFWLHADAAFGGYAACSEKYAHYLKGINYADSITIDAHKWLNVPYDSAMHFTRHPSIQLKVFKSQAPYLGDASLSPDFHHYTPETSRRFRALPAWFTLMAYGKDGYREIVERNCALAHQLGEKIASSTAFRLLAPVNMNVVCFTLNIPDLSIIKINEFLTTLHAQNQAFLTPTVYKETPGIRIAVSNWQTLENDIHITWQSMIQAWESIKAI